MEQHATETKFARFIWQIGRTIMTELPGLRAAHGNGTKF
jgi:hypothetical protein